MRRSIASPFAASLVMASVIGFGAEPAPGGLVVDQQPFPAWGAAADTSFTYFGETVWQQIADDILLTSSTTIRRISWWGFYGNPDGHPVSIPPSGSETMRIRFYAPDANNNDLPGASLYEVDILNPARTATGQWVAGFAQEFLFSFDLPLPFLIPANERRWLEIVQVGDAPSMFSWEAGFGNSVPFAVSNSYTPSWQYEIVPVNVAFQLYEIPEPASLGIMIMVLFVLRASPSNMKEGRKNRSCDSRMNIG